MIIRYIMNVGVALMVGSSGIIVGGGHRHGLGRRVMGITPALFVALKPFGSAEDEAVYQTGVQIADVRKS
jgi:hypothetical protein